MAIEKHLDDNKRRHGKGNRRRRLRKTYQLSESDDEGCSQQKKNSNRSSVVASDDDDNYPISMHLKSRVSAKKCLRDGGENANKEIDQTYNKKAENYGNYGTESKPNDDDLLVGSQPMRYKFYLPGNA